jgi:hypothetical protein
MASVLPRMSRYYSQCLLCSLRYSRFYYGGIVLTSHVLQQFAAGIDCLGWVTEGGGSGAIVSRSGWSGLLPLFHFYCQTPPGWR